MTNGLLETLFRHFYNFHFRSINMIFLKHFMKNLFFKTNFQASPKVLLPLKFCDLAFLGSKITALQVFLKFWNVGINSEMFNLFVDYWVFQSQSLIISKTKLTTTKNKYWKWRNFAYKILGKSQVVVGKMKYSLHCFNPYTPLSHQVKTFECLEKLYFNVKNVVFLVF